MTHVNDLVMHCIDFRFQENAYQWVKENLAGQADRVVLAGASKAILDDDTRETVLKQIKIAMDLHGMKVVHLMDHIDCGAYGGSGQHENKVAEMAMHRERLGEARRVLSERFVDLEVKLYVMDFDKISSI